MKNQYRACHWDRQSFPASIFFGYTGKVKDRYDQHKVYGQELSTGAPIKKEGEDIFWWKKVGGAKRFSREKMEPGK